MSRLSWNEIRVRAAAFARDWADAHYERGQTQTFYNEFFHVLGLDRKRVAPFEHAVKMLTGAQGFVDLFWPGKLIVEQKSRGRDLARARDQAYEYCRAVEPAQHPEYLLLCDFATFRLEHLESREVFEFELAELPRRIELFGFLLGVRRREFRDQDPVNIAAAEKLGALHDALLASGYTGHALERLLVRIVFCLFADDTGIFESNALEDYLRDRTRDDGSDLGMQLTQLFQVLNTPEERRQRNLDADLVGFPYINGALFAEMLPIPSFDSAMRRTLLQACEFDWSRVSPAVFGSLFQSVMDAQERREKGAHYTTEANILKVIEPLFLDDLRAELERARRLRRGGDRDRALVALHERLANMHLFDPACGCGNFLVIAYRELRELEMEILAERQHNSVQVEFAGDLLLSRINVDQFHGIEIGEFAAEIARTAMWMMDHIMNMRLGERFGQVHVRIPLKAAANIVHGDALEVDWTTVVSPSRCTHILGNPPFGGKHVMTPEMRAGVQRVVASDGVPAGDLDAVAAWFLLAARFLNAPQSRTEAIALVATASITQGEQVPALWPQLLTRQRLHVHFAYRPFVWDTDTRSPAHVHVVVVGLEPATSGRRVCNLYEVARDRSVTHVSGPAITPYLTLGTPTIVNKSRAPLSPRPKAGCGSKPSDGKHLILSEDEKASLEQTAPEAAGWIRRYVGAEDYIHGLVRYCLWLRGVSPASIRAVRPVAERVAAVREFRSKSTAAPTRAAADRPAEFFYINQPAERYIVVPEASSSQRDYVPIGLLEPSVVSANTNFVIETSDTMWFAFLTSAAFMSWLRTVGGRLRDDLRFSASLVYNTFPLPAIDENHATALRKLADAVLAARADHCDSRLADLYDPVTMPPNLRKAHQALDRYVDRLYEPRGFANERERIEHLLGRYEQVVAPMLAAAAGTGAKGKRGGKKGGSG